MTSCCKDKQYSAYRLLEIELFQIGLERMEDAEELTACLYFPMVSIKNLIHRHLHPIIVLPLSYAVTPEIRCARFSKNKRNKMKNIAQ